MLKTSTTSSTVPSSTSSTKVSGTLSTISTKSPPSGSLFSTAPSSTLELGLPFGFRFLAKLDLFVRFIPYGSVEGLKAVTKFKTKVDQKEALQHLELVEGLSNYFSPSKPGNLQDLKLYTMRGDRYFRSYVLSDVGYNVSAAAEQQALICESLKLNLHALQNSVIW
jgi:hypothetical protein